MYMYLRHINDLQALSSVLKYSLLFFIGGRISSRTHQQNSVPAKQSLVSAMEQLLVWEQ